MRLFYHILSSHLNVPNPHFLNICSPKHLFHVPLPNHFLLEATPVQSRQPPNLPSALHVKSFRSLPHSCEECNYKISRNVEKLSEFYMIQPRGYNETGLLLQPGSVPQCISALSVTVIIQMDSQSCSKDRAVL